MNPHLNICIEFLQHFMAALKIDLVKEAVAKPTTSTRTSCIPGDVKCGGIANVAKELVLPNECGKPM